MSGSLIRTISPLCRTSQGFLGDFLPSLGERRTVADVAPKGRTSDPRTVARTNVPKAVLTFMTDRGIGRLQIMATLDCSKQTLSDRLKGKSPFKDEELLALSWLFDCDPGEFFRDHPDLNRRRMEGHYAKPGSLGTAGQAPKTGPLTTAKAA